MRTIAVRSRLHRRDRRADRAGKQRALASVTLVTTVVNFASVMRARNAASDKSNSWLPSVAHSEADGVQHVHHLPAGDRLPVHARGPDGRRRQKVPSQRRQHGRSRQAEAIEHRGDARQASDRAALDGIDLVHVVDVGKDDGRGRLAPEAKGPGPSGATPDSRRTHRE